jgi:hypothetical protein
MLSQRSPFDDGRLQCSAAGPAIQQRAHRDRAVALASTQGQKLGIDD